MREFTLARWNALRDRVLATAPETWTETAVQTAMWHCDCKVYCVLGDSLTGATYYKTVFGVRSDTHIPA